ncbi:MAG: multicopper oxidase domain-containing protein, partial [Phycisphaerales bacterium]|nr:multicopper oxidase domain-containing protein [Phycisphaerales bacterium]
MQGRTRLRCWLAGAAAVVCALAAPAFGQLGLKPEPLKIDLTQSPRAQQIMPTGPATNGLSYSGTVVAGPAGSLVPVPNSYLGPTIHTWAGQDVSIRLINQIGQESITHWHGLDVPADMDGYPTATVPSGSAFGYRFPILNRAGTYWYHPHTNMLTAPQVYAGLAGFFIVHDNEEAKLRLPSGAYDLPLCIQDATFDTSNQRVYNPGMVAGFLGTTQLVNGQPNYVHSAATRVYRLRLLNGA